MARETGFGWVLDEVDANETSERFGEPDVHEKLGRLLDALWMMTEGRRQLDEAVLRQLERPSIQFRIDDNSSDAIATKLSPDQATEERLKSAGRALKNLRRKFDAG
jgi:hypothetical protein